MTSVSTPNAQPASRATTPMGAPLAAPISPTDDNDRHETHTMGVVGGEDLRPGHRRPETHITLAGSDLSASSDQSMCDTQDRPVAAGIPSTDSDPVPDRPGPELLVLLAAGARIVPEHTIRLDGGSSNQPPVIPPPTSIGPAGDGWLELRVWAEMFDAAQQSRIANVNRAERGGADPDIFAAHIDALGRTEHECRLALRRTYRRVVPTTIKAWQQASVGIGIDMLGRLLGHLGHPVWATPHHWEGTGTNRVLITDPPFERTVGQLWQFCGHGAPARRTKGMTADDLAAQGSPTLKMLVHLNAEMCMKQRTSPYRLVYEQARQGCTDKVHTVECVRCGPSGKPAPAGSPWSAGHRHAHALRITGKEILRDLWIVSQQAPGVAS